MAGIETAAPPDGTRSRPPIAQVLTIAGSDSGGGAGIQADIKAIQANGVFALSVLTSITAQNTKTVVTAFDLPLRVIEAQIRAVFDDFTISAVKTGMLSSKGIVKRVAQLVKEMQVQNLIVDPVMVSKSGYPLLKPEAIAMMKSELFPLAALVTPNIHEAELLTGNKIRTAAEAEEAARKIHLLGCRAVLVKGGHLLEERGCDLLFDGNEITCFRSDFIESQNTHGTGCTYSAAIAAQIASGKTLKQAVQEAKTYVTEAIRHGLSIGHGHGPTDHFYFLPSRKR
ncbi:bifunctional hydroxymethylpyrimidine kinase/phosphomethylpyrimidine kinase [Candidatus Manganitrophus noduliformans]|uniref:hydroxymethylpyrimidine kinase n=1 Tax=Candidatus Manganitrophus noduliformans TaxID=2606439 RepID=A0A7X6IB34_9BACT|nr:bifunctional hydroxymethylpyrimidine kinase/phosphomethylpyrimidine kinase [Candidatus Manganitrophus noduliformans]NKE71198.1 bifunctional hydroxymethylpyrimidine kinase/phosphomethylpyrimidine kinase [Candidatus Manganitrophus noduliformans]